MLNLNKILAYLFINFVRIFNLVELYQPTYNPRNFYLCKKNIGRRVCDERIFLITKEVDFSRFNSYLDIGSQLGYFVFKFAEVNPHLYAQGMEMNSVASMYAKSVAVLNELENVSFINVKMTLDTIRDLPKYDVISFLNVYHHIVYFESYQYAHKIMQALYNKCKYCLIFETGQSDEKGYYWSEKLNFMGETPTEWIFDYLKLIGYRNVKIIGMTSTHLSSHKRRLFLCQK